MPWGRLDVGECKPVLRWQVGFSGVLMGLRAFSKIYSKLVGPRSFCALLIKPRETAYFTVLQVSFVLQLQ